MHLNQENPKNHTFSKYPLNAHVCHLNYQLRVWYTSVVGIDVWGMISSIAGNAWLP